MIIILSDAMVENGGNIEYKGLPCWMCGTSGTEPKAVVGQVSLAAVDAAVLLRLQEAVAAASKQVEQWHTRVRHAAVAQERVACMIRFQRLATEVAVNIYDVRLYKDWRVDVRRLPACAETDWQWKRMCALYKSERGYSIESALEAMGGDTKSELRAFEKLIAMDDDTKAHLHRLQLAIHPDKCSNDKAGVAFGALRKVAERSTATAFDEIRKLAALLPNAEAVIQKLVGPIADKKCDGEEDTPTEESKTERVSGRCRSRDGVPKNRNVIIEEIARELNDWTRATWYEWTRPEFVLPVYYTTKERLVELHRKEHIRQLIEDEHERKRKLIAKERPIREDRYVEGQWRGNNYQWWRTNNAFSRQQRKYDLERLKWNKQHAQWKQRQVALGELPF
jgi:hypothetical protein